MQVKFLHDRIKVNGKAGVLGDSVRIDSDKTRINVDAKLPFSKRYLKVCRPAPQPHPARAQIRLADQFTAVKACPSGGDDGGPGMPSTSEGMVATGGTLPLAAAVAHCESVTVRTVDRSDQ